MKRLRKAWLRYWGEIASLQTSDHSIALGFALGAFIGILPTPGLSIPLCLLAILFYPKVSKVAVFGALVLFNPFTNAPLNVLSFKIGHSLFPATATELPALHQFLSTGWRYLVGNAIVAAIIAGLGYGLLRLLLSVHRPQGR